MILRFLFAALAFAVLAMPARADIIYVRGQENPLTGNIKSEDAKSVVVSLTDKKKKGDESVPSVDILDIVYETVSPSVLVLPGGAYRAAKDFEKQAEKEEGAIRNTTLGKAIASYTETLKKMARDTAAQKFAARHMEYKVALLNLRRATDQASTDVAVKKLTEFSDTFSDSWQNNIVLPLIAQLHLDAKDFDKAEKTYEKIASTTAFSVEVRRDAELKVIEVSVKAGNIDQANKKLDALEKKAAGNTALLARVKMARAEVFVGQKQYAKATPLLQEVIKNNNDKITKAMAHNTLGECLFKEGKYNEALWEFLWVDAVFNQDRNQHAKALFYLWKTFQQLNNAERAQECRNALIEDRQFTGTEWQREALKK